MRTLVGVVVFLALCGVAVVTVPGGKAPAQTLSGGGGANTSLSNLSSPTAINQTLTIAGANGISMTGGGTLNVNNGNIFFSAGSLTGGAGSAVTSTRYFTDTPCSSTASPAVCGSLTAGSSVIAAAATTEVINTTNVTANSQIWVTADSSLGARLGVTCNTTIPTLSISARTAATSFTVTASSAPTTNPLCFGWHFVN